MGDKHINISISAMTVFKAVLVLLGFYAAYLLSNLVLTILAAVVIASAVEPATRWFGRYGVPRVPAVLAVYIVAGIVLFSLVYFFAPPLIAQTTNFVSQVPEYLQKLQVQQNLFGFNNPLSDASGTGGNTGGLSTQGIGEQISNSLQLREALQDLRQAASQLSSGVFQTVSTIFGGVVSFILIVVFSFYLSVQERGIEKFLRVVVPYEYEEYTVNLWNRAQAKIGRYIQGQLVLVLIMGVLTYLGLMIIGVPHAFLLAVAAGLAELIPLFGPILAAIPAIGVAFAEGGVTLVLLVIGLYLILQQFENHLIYPLVVKKVVGVPALLVIIALIAGGQLGGFLGVLLSVPMAAVLQELANDVQEEKRRRYDASNTGQQSNTESGA